VSLGQMTLSLSPLGFRVENAVIDEAPEFKTGRPFAAVQTLYVRPELLPLLHGEVRIDSLRIHQPKVELVRTAQGAWNFASLAAKIKERDENGKEKAGAFSLSEM